jgi:hypothetical protein
MDDLEVLRAELDRLEAELVWTWEKCEEVRSQQGLTPEEFETSDDDVVVAVRTMWHVALTNLTWFKSLG